MDILIQLLITETKKTKASRGEPVGAPLIVLNGIRLQMLRAIELDDEFCREANEVDNVGTDRSLSAKLVAAEFLGAEEMPETLFRISRIVAQLAGEVALVFVAVHTVLIYPPP